MFIAFVSHLILLVISRESVCYPSQKVSLSAILESAIPECQFDTQTVRAVDQVVDAETAVWKWELHIQTVRKWDMPVSGDVQSASPENL